MIWKKNCCFLGHQCILPYAYLSFITQVHSETCQGIRTKTWVEWPFKRICINFKILVDFTPSNSRIYLANMRSVFWGKLGVGVGGGGEGVRELKRKFAWGSQRHTSCFAFQKLRVLQFRSKRFWFSLPYRCLKRWMLNSLRKKGEGRRRLK